MTQIQALENMSQPEVVALYQELLQRYEDDIAALSKELASKSLTVPHGYRLVHLSDIDTAIQRAHVFDDGGDGADPESARSCIAILRSMIKTDRTAPSPDPYIELMSEQAQLINLRRLQHWLTKYGISTPESLEELGAKRGHYVNALTRQEPFGSAAPTAPVAAQAQWIEHCNITDIPDAVLTPSGLAIKNEQADTSVDKTSEMQGLPVDGTDKMQDSLVTKPFTACNCPSGNGSLRWPCPVHPPESEQENQNA